MCVLRVRACACACGGYVDTGHTNARFLRFPAFSFPSWAGFIGGQFCATPEGQEHARAKRQELEARRRQAATGPKPLLRL